MIGWIVGGVLALGVAWVWRRAPRDRVESVSAAWLDDHVRGRRDLGTRD